MEPKIFLAIPNMGWLHSQLVVNIIPWMRDWNVTLFAPNGLRPIPYARNFCVKAFLESGCTHLWFVDADTVPGSDALGLLLSAKVAAISGIVRQMKVDTDGTQVPVGIVVRKNDQHQYKEAVGSGVERIDACGSGCILLSREVFDRIPFPWYEERVWGDVRGSDFILGEKLEQVGIPLYAHFGVQCLHRKEVDF